MVEKEIEAIQKLEQKILSGNLQEPDAVIEALDKQLDATNLMIQYTHSHTLPSLMFCTQATIEQIPVEYSYTPTDDEKKKFLYILDVIYMEHLRDCIDYIKPTPIHRIKEIIMDLSTTAAREKNFNAALTEFGWNDIDKRDIQDLFTYLDKILELREKVSQEGWSYMGNKPSPARELKALLGEVKEFRNGLGDNERY